MYIYMCVCVYVCVCMSLHGKKRSKVYCDLWSYECSMV